MPPLKGGALIVIKCFHASFGHRLDRGGVMPLTSTLQLEGGKKSMQQIFKNA